jgi:hypothetical protein
MWRSTSQRPHDFRAVQRQHGVGLHGTGSGGDQRGKGRSRERGEEPAPSSDSPLRRRGTDEHTLEGSNGGRLQWRRDETGTDQ